MSEEYTGTSFLSAPSATAAPPPGSAPTSPPLPSPPSARALLLTLRSGREVVAQHADDPYRAPTVYLWGERFVQFDDGTHVRVDVIDEARAVDAADVEAARRNANHVEPVPVVLAGAPAEPEPIEVPLALWPVEALEAELKRLDPAGIADSTEIREVREALTKRKNAPAPGAAS